MTSCTNIGRGFELNTDYSEVKVTDLKFYVKKIFSNAVTFGNLWCLLLCVSGQYSVEF